MSKYVLDTNVLISNPYSLYSFTEQGTEIIITSATLGELDHLKSKESVSREARLAIRLLSKVILNHSYEDIQKGIPLNETNPAVHESIKIRIADYKGDEDFKLDQQDARIIATCKQEGATLITRDINMLLIAMSSGCPAKQYTGDDTIKDSDVLYTGYIQIDDFWNTLEDISYRGKTAIIPYSTLPETDFYVGMYIYGKVGEREEFGKIEDVFEVYGVVVEAEETYLAVDTINNKEIMNRKIMKAITPRDAFQGMAFDAMLTHDIDVVTLMGGAGSGKTIQAVAGAMQMINTGHYANLMYVKADSPLAGEVGFLPGTLGDKLRPSVEPCITSLNILYKDSADPEKKVDELIETNIVQFPSLFYFRGRSIGHPDAGKGTVLIVDECQNLSNHEMKSIISRCGENTLLILCGNIKQIDNPRNTAVNNGFVYAVEKFKNYEFARHVILKKIYRSRLAAFVEDNF